MSHVKHHKLIILGSGPAGCTAALYAARAGLNPVLITGRNPGGQLTTTTEVDNWPGDVAGLLGPELMDRMHQHAQKFGAVFINDHIDQINFQTKPFMLQGNQRYSADAVIIATGATAKFLGLPEEQQYLGKGVSSCATCDGFFYRHKKVAIVGGGNTAVEEALYLSNLVEKLFFIHRRHQLKAEKILQDKLLMKAATTAKIEFIWESKITKIIGDAQGVTGINVTNINTNNVTYLALDGVFIAIGHTPNTTLFNGQLTMHNGYLVVNSGTNGNSTATKIPGVFAAGDVADHVYRQAITSAGSGCMAALDAEKYLQANC